MSLICRADISIDDDGRSRREADKEMTWKMQNVTNNNVVFNIANWYLQDTKMAFLPPSKWKKSLIAYSSPSFISIDQTQ